MIEYNITELSIAADIKPWVRRFSRLKASIKAPVDQPFFPIGYVRIPHSLHGRPAISVKDKGVIRQTVKDGPYFSGLIDGDNAYMHFTEDLDWFVMELSAGAPYTLFHLDMHNLVNTTTHFSSVSNVAEAFNGQALRATTEDAVIAAYETFIRHCATKRRPSIDYIDEAAALIESRRGAISVQEVVDSIRMRVNYKQFNRNFKKVIGLSPKHWARVLQINYAGQLLECQDNLTEIAHQAGFYDQSHFISAFHQFVRTNPREFIRGHQNDIVKYAFNQYFSHY